MTAVKARTRKPLIRIFRGAAATMLVFAVVLTVAVFALQYSPPQSRHQFDSGPFAPIGDHLGWTTVGGDDGHTRFADIGQLTRGNVGHLEEAWRFSTGEVGRRGKLIQRSKFQATPIIASGNLVLCTPFNRVIALDPRNGREVWSFDAEIDLTIKPSNDFNCRGVAQWTAPAAPAGTEPACSNRILMGTNDRRLIALDARTGKRCSDFGQQGEIEVVAAEGLHWPGEVQIVSAPAVVGDVVVVGSSIADSIHATAAKGDVRAFDARTGAPLWTFDPVPGGEGQTGGGNVWSSISVDRERDLVFLPTSSPSPDFFGGKRAGDPSLANAIVALRGRTGELVWAFQTVRHDLWDYDVPAAPSLLEINQKGERIPALAFATKTGFVFVLNRATGEPLFPVRDTPVPRSDVAGERASPTQPFSSLPTVAPQGAGAAQAFGVLGFDRASCAERLSQHRNEGLFTPPSLRGSVLSPTTGGGANWGGVTLDPRSGRLFVNTSRAAEVISLVPAEAAGSGDGRSHVTSPQEGAPFAASRGVLLSPIGMPCTAPPWGGFTAVDLNRRAIAWDVPLGTTSRLAPLGIALDFGTPNLGGSVATAGGLLFIGAAMDDRIRAFDMESGEALWSSDLPAGGQATPMTYAIDGRQYVVIAAGGHSVLGTRRGDEVVAYALPKNLIKGMD